MMHWISVFTVARFSKVPIGALYPAKCLGCPGAVGLSIAWCQALSPAESPRLPGTWKIFKDHRDRNLQKMHLWNGCLMKVTVNGTWIFWTIWIIWTIRVWFFDIHGPQMTNGCDFAESKLQGRDLWLWSWRSLAGSCVEASGARLFCRCFASKEKWKSGKTAANPCFSMVILRYSEIVLRYGKFQFYTCCLVLRMIPLNIERLCGAQLSYWGFGCNLWSLLFWQGVWCLLYRQKQRCFAWV